MLSGLQVLQRYYIAISFRRNFKVIYLVYTCRIQTANIFYVSTTKANVCKNYIQLVMDTRINL